MRSRKVTIVIEANTTLSYKELQELQAMVFGRVRRKSSQARGSRQTIRREMPKWVGHDTAGTIDQVQINIIDKKRR